MELLAEEDFGRGVLACLPGHPCSGGCVGRGTHRGGVRPGDHLAGAGLPRRRDGPWTVPR